MVATGGTISNRDGGRLTAEELAKSMPGLERVAHAHLRAVRQRRQQPADARAVASALPRRVNELFAGDKDLAGMVVTSGTDTLEETAFFLHLTVRDPRPVVVVGSMRNPSTLGYEGAANLLEGVRVAADPAARDKGALVVLNDEINSARDVQKTDALRLQTFRSREYGQLGVVDSDRVVFFRQPLQRHTAKSEFDVTTVKELPRVDVMMVYQDAPGDLIKAAVDAGAKGDRDRRRRRRRDQRHAERRARLRGAEGRVHRHEHADRIGAHRAAAQPPQPATAPSGNTDDAKSGAGAPSPVHGRGGGPRAAQGARSC